MLSLESAKSFLETVLGFTDWNTVLERDKLEFLRILVAHYAHHTYFQSISMTAVPPEQRRAPDESEILSLGLKGFGGACVVQNGFLTLLLKALGFNSYVVSGFVHGPGNCEDNHVLCLVEFTAEEKYLLDLGVALPFVEPVPLHQIPYTKTAAGVRYVYRLSEENSNLYVRVQCDGGLFGARYDDKNLEFVRYDFTTAPRSLNFFVKTLAGIFTKVEESFFLRTPFLFRYFEEDEAGNLTEKVNVHGDRKWILIRGLSVVIGSDEAKTAKNYSNYDEIKDIALKYFPKLPIEEVTKAFEYFTEAVTTYGYFKAS